jgi:DNA-binding MarR family transcriptional regulator
MSITQEKTNQVYKKLEEALYLYFRMITGGSHDFCSGVILSMTEIHMVSKVYATGSITVTELAKQFLVSKGAISLLLSKLVKKGLLEKCPEEKNRSKVCVTVTPLGKKAAEQHTALHEKHNARLFAYLAELDEQELAVAENFSKEIRSWLHDFYKDMVKR